MLYTDLAAILCIQVYTQDVEKNSFRIAKDHNILWSFCEFPFWLKEMAPDVGLEPTTFRLTAERSTD